MSHLNHVSDMRSRERLTENKSSRVQSHKSVHLWSTHWGSAVYQRRPLSPLKAIAKALRRMGIKPLQSLQSPCISLYRRLAPRPLYRYGIQEVVGSIPIGSTKNLKELAAGTRRRFSLVTTILSTPRAHIPNPSLSDVCISDQMLLGDCDSQGRFRKLLKEIVFELAIA